MLASLPLARRRTVDAYAELIGAFATGQQFGPNAERYRETATAVARVHPEGYLILMQATLDLPWAFALPLNRPENLDEYVRRVQIQARTFERGAAAHAMFPVQDMLADMAFMMHAATSNRDVLGARVTPEMTRRTVELLRDRARQWGELPSGFVLEPAVTVCLREREYDIARQLLGCWEREKPNEFAPHRWRAEIEYDAGAYRAAARAAARALELKPGNAPMARLLAAARVRCVPFDVAPPPRAKP